MKETGQCPNLPDPTTYIPYHPGTNIYGSALETLPEEEGDNDSSGEDVGSSCDSSCSSEVHWGNNGMELSLRVLGSNSTKNSQIKTGCDISQQSPKNKHEIESQRAKVLLLENRIRELEDELKESKDQNELLEFRLLELGEFEFSSSSGAHAQVVDEVDCNEEEEEIGKRCKRRRSKSHDHSDIDDRTGVEALVLGSRASQVQLYETDDGAEEVTNPEESSSNSHSSVAEARSSCSDCSESLSFQESGIFENQFTEDSYSAHSGRTTTHEDISRELGRFVSQIESLIHGFGAEEGQETKGSKDTGGLGIGEVKGNESRIQHRKANIRSKNDLCYEFLTLRSRIQEFERKLRKFGNTDYITSLEDKISILLLQSQKLEEEKAEMEEAENDNRNQFQRMEEKVQELKEKKGLLQHQLTNERRFIEQLRVQLIQSNETEEDLRCRVTQTESTIQNYEQRNFDLEESLIELKDSIQFLIFSIPLLSLWVLYTFRSRAPKPLLALPISHHRETITIKTVDSWTEVIKIDKVEIGIQTSHELWPDLNILSAGKRSYKDNWSPTVKEISQEEKELEKKKIREEENLLENSSRGKLKALQEKWDALIKELDEFEVEFKKNPNEVNISRNLNQTTKLKQGSLVATRIRSLFPDETQQPPPHFSQSSPRLLGFQSSYINKIHQKVSEQIMKYELKQKDLLDEIDRLKRVSLGENKEIFENQKKEIAFYRAENNRLNSLLGEQENLWTRIKELEDEGIKLRSDLIMNGDLEKKIDEAQGYAKMMMNRVEELEENEGIWRETLAEREKKEKKTGESLTLLRNEIQIMRNKCCAMEDELELRLKQETNYKQEIHILNSKLKESISIIQDKESLLTVLTRLEESLRSQIGKLESQIEELQQEVGDLECTNGMLREEIQYFEKTLAEVSEKKDYNEKMIQILSEKIQTKDEQIVELKKQNTEYNRTRRIKSPNDLDVFARNDGGLTGVARELNEIMTLISSCIICKLAAGGKLIDISNQLNILSQMLEGSHEVSCIDTTGGQLPTLISLSRCESEEHLSSSPLGLSPVAASSVGWPCQVEENKVFKSNLALLEIELLKKEKEIQDLYERQGILSTQLKGLEEISFLREKELRESHLNECWWWKNRCQEKNELIQILARRIAHLSAIDIHGDYLLKGILREIHIVHKSYPSLCSPTTKHDEDLPLDSTSLLNYFNMERRRIMDILESSNVLENHSTDPTLSPSMDFRVLRKIGDDTLLISWSAHRSGQSDSFDSYEISVNGDIYLRVPNPNRCKAFLFGLNMSEPLQLSLKLKGGSGSFSQQESSITYIA